MAGDLASTLSSAAQDSATLALNMQAAATSAQALVVSVGGSNLSGNPGNTVVANHTTSSSQTANNTGVGGGNNNGSGGNRNGSGGSKPFDTFNAPYGTAQSIKMTGTGGLGRLLGAAASGIEAVGALLPTIQETVTAQALGERIRFFSNDATSGKGVYGNLASGIGGNSGKGANTAAYDLMRKFSGAGSATSPLDAANAINTGMGSGLLPGLSNYGVGSKIGSGILGGAALASNLVGGIGLTGGMQAMASLNQAQSVNMLKMIGVDVRNSNGTGMNDLPSIINKVYEMLKQSAGHNPTAEDISVSMQPGNALDSLLNQYFGGDSALKDVVLSGLMQQAQSGGASLYSSGTKSNIRATGGITNSITSAGYRNTSELQMIQQYAKVVTSAGVKTNTALQTAYGFLGNNSMNPILTDIAAANTGIGALAAARGGGGAVAIDNMLDLIGDGSTAFAQSQKGQKVIGKIKSLFLNDKGKLNAAGLVGAGAVGLLGAAAGIKLVVSV